MNDNKVLLLPAFLLSGISASARSSSIAVAGETEEADLIMKEVRLALVICTYNRRRDITKNVRLLKQHNSAYGTLPRQGSSLHILVLYKKGMLLSGEMLQIQYIHHHPLR